MKHCWIILLGGIVCITACDSPEKSLSAEQEPAPRHFLIEAENSDIKGEKIGDPSASSLFYVKRQSGDFQPVVSCNVPPSDKALTVWIRGKGGPVQMVVSIDGEKEAGPWVDAAESQFDWFLCGRIEPGGTDRELVFIGDDDKSQSVSIDCILFTEGPIADMDALLTPLPLISVDTEKTATPFRAAPSLWGKEIVLDSDAEDINYQAPRSIRFCIYGMFADAEISKDSFLKPDSRNLDEEKVRSFITALLGLETTSDIILNIPNWPGWMDTNNDGFLDDEKIPEYVELIGDFVEIIREIPGASERVLFEITNGMDSSYHSDLVAKKRPHKVAELGRIFLRVAQRIQVVFPEARIGGVAALDGSNIGFHEQFIALTAPELDFYSIRLRANSDTNAVKTTKAILAKNSKGRNIPLFIIGTETTGTTDSSKPVHDAFFLIDLFASGAEFATAPATLKGPASHLYHVLNAEFSGSIAQMEIDSREDMSALTTQAGNRILIAHRGLRDRRITLPEGDWTGWIIGEGIDAQRKFTSEGETQLPRVSLMYLEK